jgi:hypothetical protein
MLRRNAPEVGSWYEDAELGRVFEVVSLDEDDNSVAIQYFEGEIEALELDAFLQMPLRTIEQPEDWSGPFELDREDRYESDFADSFEEPDELLMLDGEGGMHIEEGDEEF